MPPPLRQKTESQPGLPGSYLVWRRYGVHLGLEGTSSSHLVGKPVGEPRELPLLQTTDFVEAETKPKEAALRHTQNLEGNRAHSREGESASPLLPSEWLRVFPNLSGSQLPPQPRCLKWPFLTAKPGQGSWGLQRAFLLGLLRGSSRGGSPAREPRAVSREPWNVWEESAFFEEVGHFGAIRKDQPLLKRWQPLSVGSFHPIHSSFYTTPPFPSAPVLGPRSRKWE